MDPTTKTRLIQAIAGIVATAILSAFGARVDGQIGLARQDNFETRRGERKWRDSVNASLRALEQAASCQRIQ